MVKKIKIDPGHRRTTPGKAVKPYYEWESNQRIAIGLKKVLEASGFEVEFTIDLSSDWDKPVYSRGVAGRDADLLVSIHNNAHGDPEVTGTETFVHSNSTASVPVAQAIQSALVKSLGTKDRGVKKANFGVLRGAYQHTLAVLLEGEFFTNPEARRWMMTSDFDNRYIEGAGRGICSFFGYSYAGASITQPAKPQPSKPAIKNPDKGDMVLVKVADLYTYNSKDWNDKGPIVQEDEAFTIAATHTVAGAKMYELVSGLYITANPSYVEFLPGALEAVKPIPKEEDELDKELIVINSENDYITARKLSIRRNIKVIERAAVKGKMAETIYIVGGTKKGLEGAADKFVDLSGPTWEGTVAKVSEYLKK